MADPTTPRSRTLRYKVLMAIALLVVIAWSVMWFVAATVVDRHADKFQHAALEHGAIAHCQNRSISGFPFRIEVRCASGSRLGNADVAATVDGLTAAALVYRPSQVIVEAKSPATVAMDGLGEARADWSLAHASARIDLGRAALRRFDAEVVDGTLSVGRFGPLAFEELDINGRENPVLTQDLDLAVRAVALRPGPGMDPASIAVRGTISDGAGALAGDPIPMLRALLTTGLTVTIDDATFASGAMRVGATGALTLRPDGFLDGAIELAVAGYDDGMPYVEVVAPKAAEAVIPLITNVLNFAPSVDLGGQPAKQITLNISRGRVSAGIIPLFVIPPVILPVPLSRAG